MKIKIIASDSFSVRSMATFVETKKVKIMIDPSIAIGPLRYGLKPSPLELKALKEDRIKILNALKKSTHVVISHYHFDHVPFFDDKEMYDELNKKQIFVKNQKTHINFSQKKRAYVFNKLVKNAIEIDDKDFGFISFSKPVWHGEEKTKLGYVIMTAIHDKKTFVHASDIQLLNKDALNELIRFDPDIVFASGPPTYLRKINTNYAIKFVDHLISKTRIKTLILDHHLLRDLNYRSFFNHFRDYDLKIITAAEFMKKEILQLEAHRKEFYENKNENKNNKDL